MTVKQKSSVPLLKKLPIKEWRQFWADREFAKVMKDKGIVKNEVPRVINKIFNTGLYCMVVINYSSMTYEFVKGVKQMLGFENEEFYKGKFEFLVRLVHPDDVEKVHR